MSRHKNDVVVVDLSTDAFNRQILEGIKNDDGKLPAYAWPGGYPLFYITKDNAVFCASCANEVTEDSNPEDEIVAHDANWEDDNLNCEMCEKRIPSAYASEATSRFMDALAKWVRVFGSRQVSRISTPKSSRVVSRRSSW